MEAIAREMLGFNPRLSSRPVRCLCDIQEPGPAGDHDQAGVLPLNAYAGHLGAAAPLVREGQRTDVAEAPLRRLQRPVFSVSAARLAGSARTAFWC